MEQIKFDSGMKKYRINGNGVLEFNPSDPNVFARFLEAVDSIGAIEAELTQKAAAISAETAGEDTLRLMAEADCKMKALLGTIFGSHNDFNQILQGVNLLAVADNGERVVTNLFSALEPILVDGAKLCTGQVKAQALQKARARRSKQ
jgi:hypothetical protein